MRRMLLLAALALAGLGACDPDLPGRACSVDDDCFSDEFCQGTSCVRGARGADSDAAEGDAAESASDAGPDAAPE